MLDVEERDAEMMLLMQMALPFSPDSGAPRGRYQTVPGALLLLYPCHWSLQGVRESEVTLPG